MTAALTSESTTGVRGLLASRRPGHTLPGPLYGGAEAHAADLAQIWSQEWVFAGHECELARTGDFLTLTVGEYPVVVVRGPDGRIRALPFPASGWTASRDLPAPPTETFHQWWARTRPPSSPTASGGGAA